MAAVFPRTPATVSLAGEGPTALAVSLGGSWGVEWPSGSGWGGSMLHLSCWSVAAQASMGIREEVYLQFTM